ncbi:MAG: hypothetical protein U0R80_08810 [Nocardioidaceae bacterium]
MSLSWSDSPGPAPVAATVPEALSLLRDRAADLTERTRVVPAWRLPWTAGRLFASAVLLPIALLALRTQLGHRLSSPGWLAVAIAASAMAALLVGSYVPSRLFGYGRPLGTSPLAASSFFFAVLAGFSLSAAHLGVQQAVFALAALAFGLLLRTRGTRLLWHAL